MKLFVLSALLAVAVAAPSPTHLLTPTLYNAPVAIDTIATAPIVSQYHSQDELGQYSYGYSGGLSAKSEIKSSDGVTRGFYRYLDAEGKEQSVEYTADALNGFRAIASNMPVAPVETRTAPMPVVETPEVAKARADHMAAFEEAKTRAASEPETVTETKAEGVEIIARAAAPVAAPVPVASISAPLPLLRTTENIEGRPFSFSYAYNTPYFGYNPYTIGYPYNYNFAAVRTIPFAAPQFISPAAVVGETPEVARARAEHLAAHAAARARV